MILKNLNPNKRAWKELDANVLTRESRDEGKAKKKSRRENATDSNEIDNFVDIYFPGNTIIRNICTAATEEDPP